MRRVLAHLMNLLLPVPRARRTHVDGVLLRRVARGDVVPDADLEADDGVFEFLRHGVHLPLVLEAHPNHVGRARHNKNAEDAYDDDERRQVLGLLLF
jgi:hypothetical protein